MSFIGYKDKSDECVYEYLSVNNFKSDVFTKILNTLFSLSFRWRWSGCWRFVERVVHHHSSWDLQPDVRFVLYLPGRPCHVHNERFLTL